MLPIVGRVLTDRFWQAGISEGSKDDFYARVLEKKGTLEGLASTIRGSVRFVRETCYAIIYCMSRLDVQFYGFKELPGPLAHSLLADSFCLSAHQIINLLNLVRYLVDHCPVELRDHFLPPILAACFQQMDVKIKSEWDALDQQQEIRSTGDALTEEMKAESILRQLTYTAVVMVADFLDPARTSKPAFSSSPPRWCPRLIGISPVRSADRRRLDGGSKLPSPPQVLSDAVHHCRTAAAVLRARYTHARRTMLRCRPARVPLYYPRVPDSGDGFAPIGLSGHGYPSGFPAFAAYAAA